MVRRENVLRFALPDAASPASLHASEDPRVKQFRTGDLAGPLGGTTSREVYLKDLLM